MGIIFAPAKVNLTFCIIGKVSSGYHTIDSIIQTISIYDKIILTKTRKKGIIVKCNSLDCNEQDNLAYIAAHSVFREYKINQGIKIEIHKEIPSASGLGGGSSDAAAIIKGINKLYNIGMDEEKKIEIAAKIGMDVPLFILGGTVHATGCGERVKKIKSIPNKLYFIIAKPDYGISTKDAYLKFDSKIKNELIIPDMLEKVNMNMIDAIERKDSISIAKNLYNDFERVTLDYEISKIKEIMKESSASNALMCGSGSAVFGITENWIIAREIYKNLKKENFNFIYLAQACENF